MDSHNKNRTESSSSMVGIFCVGILGIILVAGLWPLHVPRNEVTWLEKQDGMGFGRHGSIVSSGAFAQNASSADKSGSIEIWLQPALHRGSHTILSFEGSDHSGSPFSLLQRNDALIVLRHNLDNGGTVRTAWLVVEGVFGKGRPVLVTVTLEKQSTLVYVDGVLTRVSPIAGAPTSNFNGRLVIANSPVTSNNWSGEILGVAVYHNQLTPAQVALHYGNWTKNQRPVVTQDEAAVAMYLFNERAGNVVRNQLDSTTDLIIPSRYFVLHPKFLSSVSHDYKPTWSYLEDTIVNIGGFIPFGFVFLAYLSSVRRSAWPVVTTVVLGFVTSLTIEVLQTFLPTRDSGTTDLITNTLGTALGAMLYRSSWLQPWLGETARHPGLILKDPSGRKADNRITVGLV